MTGVSYTLRREHEHFQPESELDPQELRRVRGALEAIDYAAYAANRAVFAERLPSVSLQAMERLAVAAANARARWAREALALADSAAEAANEERTNRLANLRRAYEELSEAYDGLRRLIERGYARFANDGKARP